MIDKSFFVDMLTFGIPVVENINVLEVFQIIDDNAHTAGYEIIILDNQVGILDKNNNICACLKLVEEKKGDFRLMFFLTDQKKVLDSAHYIGSVLFVAISACAQLNYLSKDLMPTHKDIIAPTGKEESEEFESDFI